jgi:acyl-CoA synthetase (AMP-forming)/AMP-acid ligase II
LLRSTPAELSKRYFAAGWWTDDTLPDLTRSGLAGAEGCGCTIHSTVRPYRGTLGSVAELGRLLAGGLAARGIGAGEVVAFQLPNWAEAVACYFGLSLLGVVLVPIVHIYGTHELGHILRESKARVLITADRWGRRDFVADVDGIRGELPDLESVIVVGADHDLSSDVLSWDRFVESGERLDAPRSVGPDEPAVLGYTSGTTAAPKGVIHTHRSLIAELRQWSTFMGQDRSLPLPIATNGAIYGSPISHITGLLGVLGPLLAANPLHLADSWNATAMLATMAKERLALAPGAGYFLTTILDDPAFDPDIHLPFIARVALGGSPVPTELARRAAAQGISIVRAYGSTEHPGTTGAVHSDPPEKRMFTDGRAAPGVELRLLDDSGAEVANGEAGEIHSRGPELFAGYTDPALTSRAVDAQGWYATGDIGVLDDDGYLTVTDRKKDIIIRGGENISPAEVEQVLARLPGVAEIAVVAIPDDRYGEKGCAVIRLSPGNPTFGLERIAAAAEAAGLARQKWPEKLVFVQDFPRTASGKVQKRLLRQMVTSECYEKGQA